MQFQELSKEYVLDVDTGIFAGTVFPVDKKWVASAEVLALLVTKVTAGTSSKHASIFTKDVVERIVRAAVRNMQVVVRPPDVAKRRTHGVGPATQRYRICL